MTNGGQIGLCLVMRQFNTVQHEMLSAMLMDAFSDSDAGFLIRYRFNGNLFNLRRLQVKTKVQLDVLDELLYAADSMEANSGKKAKGHGLKDVDKLTYPGSILSRVVHIDDKVTARFAANVQMSGAKWNQA